MTDPANGGPNPDQSDEPSGERPRDFVPQYILEVTIFVAGIILGFFWCQYAAQAGPEVHLIIALIVIVLALTRLIYHITRK